MSVIDESGDSNTGKVTDSLGHLSLLSSVAIDSSTHELYVASSYFSTMWVLDTSGDATQGDVLRTIPVGLQPAAIAVDPTTHTAYTTTATGLSRFAGDDDCLGRGRAGVTGVGAARSTMLRRG